MHRYRRPSDLSQRYRPATATTTTTINSLRMTEEDRIGFARGLAAICRDFRVMVKSQIELAYLEVSFKVTAFRQQLVIIKCLVCI